ncbi:hypothetical protein [Pseudodesulfovibrio pelocollis]|uniref:hypothetical protein n=1 Tax=Pseudodesulfovibrio pelocollis TaxID=3051432 RepID=UPI00255A9FB9|nr:hypothetical protein [Pseudodesulfovibrio sp. SB368]
MNLFGLLSIFQRVRARARVCPVCGHRQVVSEERRAQAVRCDKCGAAIPPGAKQT